MPELTVNGQTPLKIPSRGFRTVEIITPLDPDATLTITSSRGRLLASFAYTATNDPKKTGESVMFTNTGNTIELTNQTTFPGGKFEIDIKPL